MLRFSRKKAGKAPLTAVIEGATREMQRAVEGLLILYVRVSRESLNVTELGAKKQRRHFGV